MQRCGATVRRSHRIGISGWAFEGGCGKTQCTADVRVIHPAFHRHWALFSREVPSVMRIAVHIGVLVLCGLGLRGPLNSSWAAEHGGQAPASSGEASPPAKEVKDKDAKDSKDIKDGKDAKDTKDTKDLKESKDGKEGKPARDSKDVKESRDAKESKDAKSDAPAKKDKGDAKPDAVKADAAKDGKKDGAEKAAESKPSTAEPEPGPKPETPTKRPVGSIMLTVKLALLADPLLLPYDIEVEMDGEKAVLSGKVATEDEKKRATEIVQGMESLKGVVNKLDIQKELAATITKRYDQFIVQAVKERFARSETLKAAGFEVKCEQGLVSLSGKTRFQVFALEAAQAARQVPGVRAVDTSNIQLSGESKE